MNNPFIISELSENDAFCDREIEQKELISHARNKANVVIVSPRRYGKTSLVKRVQSNLSTMGIVPLYIDFYGVDSVGSIIDNIVSCFYRYCHFHKKTKWFISGLRPIIEIDPTDGSASFSIEPSKKRRGIEFLREILDDFGKVATTHKEGFSVVFDEFQEITELPESKQLEGVMRSCIQTHHNVSYFFVGSRRSVLKAIFNEKKRAFFQSAINYPLSPLPEKEAVVFISDRFKEAGKECPADIAKSVYNTVGGYPVYIQRIPYSIYEVSKGDIVTHDDYKKGLLKAIEEQKAYYESLLTPLSIQQKRLFAAISKEPTANLFSVKYMYDHDLGSYGGVQGAFKKLLQLDYIEKRDDGIYYVVDPVFALWMRTRH